MAATPEKTLRRVLFISALDGWSIALFAGLCTLISLLMGEWIGVSVGALVTAAGVIELRGRRKLLDRDAGGLALLVRAQLLILAVIWLYSIQNLLAFDEATIMASITPDMRSALTQAGLSIDDFRPLVKPVYFSLYLTVIGVTLLFQGGLALYYYSCRAKVTAALAARVAVPPVLPGA
jgi:hypothetical protein